MRKRSWGHSACTGGLGDFFLTDNGHFEQTFFFPLQRSSSLAVRMEVLREKVEEEEEAEREEAAERAERAEKVERVIRPAEVSREAILSQDELRDLEGKLMAIEIPTPADHT